MVSFRTNSRHAELVVPALVREEKMLSSDRRAVAVGIPTLCGALRRSCCLHGPVAARDGNRHSTVLRGDGI